MSKKIPEIKSPVRQTLDGKTPEKTILKRQPPEKTKS